MAKSSKNTHPNPGASDVADFGDIDFKKDYPEGTHFQMPDGEEVDISQIPNFMAGEDPPEAPPEQVGQQPQNPGQPPRPPGAPQ